ncbi:MAG: hypothetical protein R2867_05490 [Caldilineaceae bacterium]
MRNMERRGDEMRATWKRNGERRAARPKEDPGETKVCTKCELEQPVSEFDKHPANRDGLHSNCKTCRGNQRRAAYGREKSETPIEELRAGWRQDAGKRRAARRKESRACYDRNREQRLEDSAKYRDGNPEKKLAHAAVERAIKRGILPPQSANKCANTICEATAQEYHHWSYEPENRLNVIPLCASCHRLVTSETLILYPPQEYAITPE